MKACSGCHKTKPLDDFRLYRGKFVARCRACEAADRRNYKQRNAERMAAYKRSRRGRVGYLDSRKFRRDHPEAAKAHSILWHARERGDICPKPCAICGSIKTQAHHDDYSKPLEVRWLCHAHHAALHAALRRAAQGSAEAG